MNKDYKKIKIKSMKNYANQKKSYKRKLKKKRKF